MMIPPVIRMGPPPLPKKSGDSTGYVVLAEKRGWFIVKWHTGYGCLWDMDRSVPEDRRGIHPDHVLCWMPEDGS